MASRKPAKGPVPKPDWESAIDAWAADGGRTSPPLPPFETHPDVPPGVVRVANRAPTVPTLARRALGALGRGGVLPL